MTVTQTAKRRRKQAKQESKARRFAKRAPIEKRKGK